ncbi:hypothetical protein FKM82_001752 [Ascaphus truei]
MQNSVSLAYRTVTQSTAWKSSDLVIIASTSSAVAKEVNPGAASGANDALERNAWLARLAAKGLKVQILHTGSQYISGLEIVFPFPYSSWL